MQTIKDILAIFILIAAIAPCFLALNGSMNIGYNIFGLLWIVLLAKYGKYLQPKIVKDYLDRH